MKLALAITLAVSLFGCANAVTSNEINTDAGSSSKDAASASKDSGKKTLDSGSTTTNDASTTDFDSGGPIDDTTCAAQTTRRLSASNAASPFTRRATTSITKS